MNDNDRWDRLADTLTEAGIPATAFRKSIHLRTPSDRLVIIRDTWWRKNPDIWTGYEVELAGRDDITIRTWRTKKRSEVLAAVREAIN